MSQLAVAPLLLAAVLALSAGAKWRDRASTLSVIAGLRLPAAIAKPWVAVALPVGELLLALGLLVPVRAGFVLAAAGTTVVMLTYLVVVARALTFDPRPTCGCFGKIGDQRIDGRTLARNLVFVGLAVVALWVGVRGHTVWSLLAAGGPEVVGWLAAAAVTSLVVWFITGARPAAQPRATPAPRPSVADDPVTEDGEYVRVPIPPADLVNRQATVASLEQLAQARPVLLVATDCFCGSTADTLARLPRWRAQVPLVEVVYVTTRPFAQHQRPDVAAPDDGWYDHQARAWHALGLGASPSAVLLGADGLLAGGPVDGVAEIDLFVSDIAAELDGFTPPEPPEFVAPPIPLLPDGSVPFAHWDFGDGRVVPVTREQLEGGVVTIGPSHDHVPDPGEG